MPTFTDPKTGKKSFHMNPQAGKSLHGNISELVKKAGSHDGEETHHGEHEFNGEKRAHHMEIHHGGHPQGQPPDDGSMTHHTVSYGEDGNQDIRNHSSMEEAKDHISNSMHDGCPECDSEDGKQDYDPGSSEEGQM